MPLLDLVRILFLFNAEKCLTQLKWQIRIRNWPLTKGASAMLLYAALLFNFTDMKKNYFPLVVCHSLLSSLSTTSSSQSWQYGAIYQKAQRQNSCEIIFLMCKQPQCACLSLSHIHPAFVREIQNLLGTGPTPGLDAIVEQNNINAERQALPGHTTVQLSSNS